MTGMDVLRSIRAYEKDVSRLKLRRMCAMDAATGATRAADIAGPASGGRKSDKALRYAEEVDAIDRAIRARSAMREMEVAEAARLILTLEPVQGQAMYLYWVRGLTLRQVAGEIKTSESSVRGLLRRARDALSTTASALDRDEAYRVYMRTYMENGGREGRLS